MKVSAIIKKPGKNAIENKSAIFASLVIIIGIISGVLLYVFNKTEISVKLSESFIKYAAEFSQKNKPEIFSGLIGYDLIFLLVMTILGTCAFGTPALICLSIVSSMGLSMLTAFIYDNFALKGIEYCLMVFLPGKFFLILALILLTQNCVVTSKSIIDSLNSKADRVVDFRKYSLRVLVIAVIIFLSAIVDFITLTGFSSLFDFG